MGILRVSPVARHPEQPPDPLSEESVARADEPPRRPPAAHALRARVFGDPPAGSTLGVYTIVRTIGRGGMGVVLEGRDPDGRRVALKTLPNPDPAAILRFKQEFRSAADLGHRNLAAVEELALDVARGEWYLAMEYIPGVRWSDHVRPRGIPLDQPAIRDALGQLASGVHALHCAGLLHRDLKPSNVLVTPAGQVKIIDFGLAASAAARHDGSLAGTRGFLAPELLLGVPASPASDWYAVGVMLFQCLTGRMPPRPLPPGPLADGVPPDLDALGRDLLAERPEDRPRGEDILRRLGLAVTPAHLPAAFVGRTRETDACKRALAAAPALVLLVGPSGTGKSALLAHLLADLRAGDGEPSLVFAGRCYEGESVPHKALDGVVDALTQHLVTCSFDQVPTIPPDEASALVRLFPALARVRRLAAAEGAAPPVDPREARRRALAGLRRLLTGLAGGRPLVLAIDDLQWGDADSARLLADLLAKPDPPPARVLATVRSDMRASSPFFRELEALDLGCPVIDLPVEPLAPDDALALSVALLGATANADSRSAALAVAIARESQGSPLFIEAMVRRRSAGEHLDDALLAQIADLEPPARAALERLAVAGRPLPRSLAQTTQGAALAALRAARLIRASGDRDAVETYHERIRAVVLRHLAADTRRDHHRVLAERLAEAPNPDADELVAHFHGAGDLPRASGWALRAADRAATALAFTRAAELYASALAWGTYPSDQVLKITLARADALVHAGRCAEAAPLYLNAAAQAPERLQEFALRGRAAEQYLISGCVEAGLAVLGPLARELDLPFPATNTGTVARLFVELGRLALHKAPQAPTQASAIDPTDLLRLDICWFAAKGLGFIDPTRAAVFSTHGMRLALACGEPRRIARADAYLALIDINGRDPVRADRARTRLEASRRNALGLGDPYLSGLTTILSGVAALNGGRWRRALADVDAGTAFLRANSVVGVTWERGIAASMAMHALMMLGDFSGLRARAEGMYREAEDTGDRFGAVVAMLYVAHATLAAGEPARARETARKAMSMWTYERFSFQRWLALGVEVACDLYEGRGEEAWRRVEASWPALLRTQLTRMQVPRIDAHLLRANAALAAAARAPDPSPWLQCAAREAAALARERIDLALAARDLIHAQIAALRGEPTVAQRLASASARLSVGEMPALAAAVQLADARRNSASIAAPERTLARCTIREPARWAATIVPALFDPFA